MKGCWAALSAVVLLFAVGPGAAQEHFPARPIDIVTHTTPGGGTDMTARTLLRGARDALGVDMAIVPRTGGGGVVAMNYVAQRPADGHTVLAITPTHLFAIARGQGPFTIDDLVPVARGTIDPLLVTVRGDSPIATLEDLIAASRERPIMWGSTQIGGIDHVAGAMLGRAADMNINVVPFAGGGEIVLNLMSGTVNAAGLNLTEALDEIERGDFRALAVMSEERLAVLPEVPTTVELGYDVTFATVRGYLVRRGTPEERIAVLERGLLAGMAHPSFQSYLRGAGLDSSGVAGRDVWGAQLERLYNEARRAMVELGFIGP